MAQPKARENIDRLQSSEMDGGKQRFLLGIVVLISVDFIWVASSELTEHIFKEEKFDKPFFSTYVKTSMFLIFLFGFLVWPPWQDKCLRGRTHQYALLVEGGSLNTAPEDLIEDPGLESSLSPSSYVPVNYDPTSSGNESDEPPTNNRVQFSKLVEVRKMNEKDSSHAAFSRLSYQASVQAEEQHFLDANRLTPVQTARLSLTFCFLWFLGNYCYQLGLSRTEAGVVNLLSSSSSLFTLLLAALCPSVPNDKFTLSKFICVLLSMGGVGLVSFDTSGGPLGYGAVFSLMSAFFYAAYLVFLRKKCPHEDRIDIPMFFGFVGLFNLLILWPFFFVLHYAGVEPFDWPTKRQWVFLVVNGVIGTVFSEVLWLWGCFLTSSLIATLAISLTIPLSMFADVLLKGVVYPRAFYLGSLPILFSFFAVSLLSHFENWDPLLQGLNRLCRRDPRREGPGEELPRETLGDEASLLENEET